MGTKMFIPRGPESLWEVWTLICSGMSHHREVDFINLVIVDNISLYGSLEQTIDWKTRGNQDITWTQ